MQTYDSIFNAAVQLPLADRQRLLDELAASFPEEVPPRLSDEWLTEIDARYADLISGKVPAVSGQDFIQ
ncbi:MAG: addiction module protein [Pirellulales bacterium]|nr:addiction module protein [Pirellulales bacterium]